MSLAGKPIVVVGSINIDLVASTQKIPAPGETISGHDFQLHPGGKGANQAVAVARLGYPVHMIGRVGDDAFGIQLREQLVAAGVETAAVKTSAGPSGVAVIVVAASGENSIVVVPGANALVSPEDLEDQVTLIRSAGMVLTQLETPLETVLHLAALCRREGVPLMLDPAPARALPRELIEAVTWFTPNESEAAFFNAESDGTDDAIAEALLKTGSAGVVLKLGARGAFVATREGLRAAVSSFSVAAVDTTAAGDCFNGAFATALCLGKDPVESARYGAAAAAIAVTRMGAQPSMPTADEVQAMLDGAAL
jgi:ribokinase